MAPPPRHGHSRRPRNKKRKGVATKDELNSSCFRWINEKLYTCSSDEAQALFQKDPLWFQVYHQGYQKQMDKWPQKPLELCKSWLKDYCRGKKSVVVADFGCGYKAQLEEQVGNSDIQFYSYDLVKTEDPRVIPCNVSHVPLHNHSVHVVVCCLSLMGTDYPNTIQEAHRILKTSGYLIIAEVTSRLQGIMDLFCRRITQIGFRECLRNTNNPFFVFLVFQKSNMEPNNSSTSHISSNPTLPQLKPCLYKKR